MNSINRLTSEQNLIVTRRLFEWSANYFHVNGTGVFEAVIIGYKANTSDVDTPQQSSYTVQLNVAIQEIIFYYFQPKFALENGPSP